MRPNSLCLERLIRMIPVSPVTISTFVGELLSRLFFSPSFHYVIMRPSTHGVRHFRRGGVFLRAWSNVEYGCRAKSIMTYEIILSITISCRMGSLSKKYSHSLPHFC